MSLARPNPFDRHVELGASIVGELNAKALPTTPREFDFWFAYRSGRAPALTAAVDAIRHTRELTPDDVVRLHAQHVSPWRTSEGPDAIVQGMAEELHGLAVALDSAIGATQVQRESMLAETTALSITTALTMQRVLAAIDHLAQSTRDGQLRYTLLETRMNAALREVSMLKHQLGVVRKECEADPLTSLARRPTFDAALAQALDAAASTRQPLAIVLCDLDYFGAFNENFGSIAADRALRTVGMLLKSHTEPCDTVARFGGDEFAVIMPGRSAHEAADCAGRFREVLMLHELARHDNGAGHLTVSIGVADAIKGDTPAFLLRRAANALRVAKSEGRNRVVEMTPDGPTWDAQRRA